MSISNTNVPRYYAEFRDKVLRGLIPVCETIAMEMHRIDDLIAHPGIYFDDMAVEGWIDFCENELTLTDGSDMKLLDSFKLWGEQIFGWYYYIDRDVFVPYTYSPGGRYVRKRIMKRLINRQYLIVARGAAKSIYDAAIHSFFLTVDTETTQQLATAPTVRQGEEILSPIRTAIARSRGPLLEFLTEGSLQNTTGSKANRTKLASTKKGIQNFLTNSILEIVPMRIEKLQGRRDKISTVDEWLSCDIYEDPIGAIQQGAGKNDDYLIVATSSEGTVRNGSGDSIKMELMKILKGEYYNPHVSIWYYRLDDVKEVADPSKWMKANPNIDALGKREEYEEDVKRAEYSPSARNDILAKRFGIPLEGFTYFFTYEETIPVDKKLSFWRMPCSLGADLSQGDDFCAFTFLFPLSEGRFGIKVRSYITEYTLNNLLSALRQKYQEFIDEGTLCVLPGTVLKMNDVYDDLSRFITEQEYEVECLGYDPYNAKDFVSRWEIDHGQYGIEKVPQGARTESVPLGELKKISEQGGLLFDEGLMSFTMGNCITIEDSNGNRKLLKRRREEKIDNVSALMDAYISYNANLDLFD